MSMNNLPFEIIDDPIERQRKLDKAKEEFRKARNAPSKETVNKTYMLVLYDTDGACSVHEVKGQAEARDMIITNIQWINIHDSFIMVEDVPFGKSKPSIYQFMKYLQEKRGYVGFDIDDYALTSNKVQQEKQEEVDVEQVRRMIASEWEKDAQSTYVNTQDQLLSNTATVLGEVPDGKE